MITQIGIFLKKKQTNKQNKTKTKTINKQKQKINKYELTAFRIT